MQLKDFKAKLRYKYIGKALLASPYGAITNKHEHSYTGSEWRKILLYDFSDSSPAFSKMFKVVKAEKKIAKKKSKKKK